MFDTSDKPDIPDAELLRRLRDVADQVPAGPVAQRIANRDYRVQRSLPRPMLTAGVTATGLAAAGAGLALALSTGASPAFAGWTATPTTGSEAQIAQAESTCTNALTTFQAKQDERDEEEQEARANEERENGSSTIRYVQAKTHDTVWKSILTDTRGPYTAFDFEGNEDGAEGFCFTGPGAHTFVTVHPKASSEPTVKPGSAISVEGGGDFYPGEGDFEMLGGLVGEGVTAIVYHLTNGTDVSASIGNGRFFVWWPPHPSRSITLGGDAFQAPVPLDHEVASTSITNSEGTTTHPWTGSHAWAEEF